MRSPVPWVKKASVARVAWSTGSGSRGGDELSVQVEARVRGGWGEGLAVLFGAEERAGLQQPGLELGVAADAVLHDVDEFGGAPLVLGLLRLVPGLADVGEDRVLVAVAVGDVVERFGDHVGDGVEPVDGADVAPGRLQGPAERLRVLDGAVAGLFGGELGVGEAAPADEDLQLHLGGDLGAGDIGVQGADQDVDRFVGGAEVDAAAVSGDLLDELEVVVPADVDAVGSEGAVHRAEAPVHTADVDQVLQDPAGDALVLGGGAVRCLGGDPGQQSGHYLVVVGTGVEVHVEGDEVDGGQGDFGHRVHRVGAGQIRLARVEVVQRGGAGERAQPT
ncbi:hypothetical protein F558DRAFT_05331 [Streptomyces sp. AmelKG-A3]|nr:hypothetical protein F558DRAFT_05331 [Streptomyces sp. AmelKG-A3]